VLNRRETGGGGGKITVDVERGEHKICLKNTPRTFDILWENQKEEKNGGRGGPSPVNGTGERGPMQCKSGR